DHALGESFYNPWLSDVVNDLLQRGIARESEGAVGVFSDGILPPKQDPFLVNRDGEWVADPALVRKSDGGFNYMTTDLATLDYVFSWEKMLSLQGNTVPYLQYAYARIRSIFRKAGDTSGAQNSTANAQLNAPEELALAKHLLNFGITLEAVAEDYRPNFLCNY